MGAAQRLEFPLILVNWCEARSHWRRYSCTGADVIKMQRAREMNEALYNGYGEPPESGGKKSDDGSGGGPVRPVRPPPIKPFTLA